MQLAFVVPMVIRNDTDQHLILTPVGIHESDTSRLRRYLLPMFSTKFPAFRVWSQSRFRVAPGGSLETFVDIDDFEWSETIIETEDGEIFQQAASGVISNLADLDPIIPEVKACLTVGFQRYHVLLLLAGPGILVNAISLIIVLRRRRGSRTRPSRPA